jgi:hypothetical protein
VRRGGPYGMLCQLAGQIIRLEPPSPQPCARAGPRTRHVRGHEVARNQRTRLLGPRLRLRTAAAPRAPAGAVAVAMAAAAAGLCVLVGAQAAAPLCDSALQALHAVGASRAQVVAARQPRAAQGAGRGGAVRPRGSRRASAALVKFTNSLAFLPHPVRLQVNLLVPCYYKHDLQRKSTLAQAGACTHAHRRRAAGCGATSCTRDRNPTAGSQPKKIPSISQKRVSSLRCGGLLAAAAPESAMMARPAPPRPAAPHHTG